MHRVVKAHLKDFVDRFSVDGDESRSFEAFVSYVLLRSFSADNISPSELTYVGDDPGIDAVLVFIDDRYVSSPDEVVEQFKNRKRDSEVDICFVQAKTSESWDKKEITAFASGVLDFLSDKSEYPISDYLQVRKEVFNELIANVGRIRGGKPRCHCYFATTARPISDEREINAALSATHKSIEALGLFSSVAVLPLDREKLVDLWNAADGPVEASLTTIGIAAFPRSQGIEESYVATVRAQDFVSRILAGENGKIRQRIFEENVRDFIGADNGVNAEISASISDQDRQSRFGILNNGITIISSDVRVQGNELFLRDFQIVNGCQTSNVLHNNLDKIGADATLMLKVVETSDASLIDEIVRSTNRQTKVQDDQFLATLDCVKGIERYFNARGIDEDHRLYFERRSNQYYSDDIPAIRIFDITEIARCVGAMFLDKPELASRYPNRLTVDLQSVTFRPENIEDIYYTAAYSLYRLKLLISNKKIDPKYYKLRWHILMALKYLISKGRNYQITSQKIRDLCQRIDEFMSKSDDDTVNRIVGICEKIVDIDDVTRDKLKGPTLTADIIKRLQE